VSRCVFPRCFLSRCVILATRTVATGGFGKVIRASHQILSSIASVSCAFPSRNWPVSSRSARQGAGLKARCAMDLDAYPNRAVYPPSAAPLP